MTPARRRAPLSLRGTRRPCGRRASSPISPGGRAVAKRGAAGVDSRAVGGSGRRLCVVTMALVALAVATVPARADWQAAVDLSPPGTPDGAPCQTGLPSVAASKDGSFLVAWQRKLDAAANDNTIIEARLIGRKGELEPLFQLS